MAAETSRPAASYWYVDAYEVDPRVNVSCTIRPACDRAAVSVIVELL